MPLLIPCHFHQLIDFSLGYQDLTSFFQQFCVVYSNSYQKIHKNQWNKNHKKQSHCLSWVIQSSLFHQGIVVKLAAQVIYFLVMYHLNTGQWCGKVKKIGEKDGDNLPSPVGIGLTLRDAGFWEVFFSEKSSLNILSTQWCQKVKNIRGASSNRWG